MHGYDDVKAAGPTTADGAVLVSRFDFRSRRRIAGFAHSIYEFSVTAYIHGLGYSFVDIHERTIGINSRLWILATPVDGTFIDLVLVSQMRDIRKPKRPIAGLAFLPVKLRTSFMNKIWTLMQMRDVLQDVEIWGRKRYRPHPSLCRSDGAIAGFAHSIYEFLVTAYVHGLGYSFVDLHEHTIGMDSRLWVLATPVDGTFIDLVLAGQVQEIRKPKRPIAGLAFLPVKLRTSLMNKIWIFMQKRDVIQDVEIWGRKSYRPHPRLCRSDGAICRYRRYCKQFYPHGDDSGDRW